MVKRTLWVLLPLLILAIASCSSPSEPRTDAEASNLAEDSPSPMQEASPTSHREDVDESQPPSETPPAPQSPGAPETEVPAAEHQQEIPSTPAASPESTPPISPSPSLELEEYEGGYFSIRKPAGWGILTGGTCSTFGFLISDPGHPLNQIFYFNEVGPVYLDYGQKQVDQSYMAMGGYPIAWFEMPVVSPLTPENFLMSFDAILQTNIARSFMQRLPVLHDVEIISAETAPFPLAGSQCKIIRALFRGNDSLGEGLFHVAVAPILPSAGLPGGGIGYGFSVTGVTATKSEFGHLQEKLVESLRSLHLSQAYISNCLVQQQQQLEGILKAGETLSDVSDLIMESWENRSRSDDILSEKRSDAILGRERIYDPDTGNVYEVPLGFYEYYDVHRDLYEMDDLQPLPEGDWTLWTAPLYSGDAIH